jgi:hypothetical protein
MSQDKKEQLEEQVLSKAAEIGLSSQLDEMNKLDVDVRTDVFKILQGQVDSVSVAGKGLVQKDIRVEEIEIHVDNIAIDILSAIFGQLELDQPTDATARVVLTEQDINRALNSEYVRSKLSPLELNVEGELVSIELQLPVEVKLPGDGKMVFSGEMLLHERSNTQQIGFIGVIHPRTSKQPLLLEAFSCTPGQGISLELNIALMQKAKELVSLPYYEIQGTAFRIKDMDVQKGSMTVQVEAHLQTLSFEQ